MKSFPLFLALSLIPLGLLAQSDQGPGGEVRVPLSDYTQMVDSARHDPRRPPVGYAIGQSRVVVKIVERDDRTTAQVHVELSVETFEDEWVLIPILPSGAALNRATVNERPVQLVQGPDGLAWSTATAGTATVELDYSVDAQRSPAGFVVPVPVPRAAATRLDVSFPGTEIDLAVVPSADMQTVESNGTTRVTAGVPATSAILVSWRTPTQLPYAVSRARYEGELQGEALVWHASFDIEMFTGEQITLPLMPGSVTLSDIRLDGKQATVLEDDGFFATVLQGRGLHTVVVSFQVPVIADDGPPRAQLHIPRVPVSNIVLTLPGKKEVKVSPAANVATEEHGDGTRATIFVPMVDRVTLTWSDAVPVDVRTRVRANASLYHALHAEEGVLHGRGVVVYEITHGETNQLHLEIPKAAQVNRIAAPSGGVADWAVVESDDIERQQIDVFLDRAVTGEFVLDVSYERLLGGAAGAQEALPVPLLAAANVHRQRGMVALLAGQELTLTPVGEERLSRVGENQLPPFIRNQITMTVAHTYKYTDRTPQLLVRALAPERKQGKFDAQVDTLISLGEVTMKGAATVEIDVKSGSIVDLALRLPPDVNVLGVSGPSLRSHEIGEHDEYQSIVMEFTREMEGQFRLEVNYELITSGGESETRVPKLSVVDAQVEHGRIAIEALTAVEVKPIVTEQLSTLDINELPQQLVLKTTNPILLAYRYVHAVPAVKLALKITRHREIDVQVAAIERADYKSLFTRDGLAVTTARFMVRNSRRQFLRLRLPADTQVWSVFVDGKAEKPAFAKDVATDDPNVDSEGAAVLIRMINSATGFPVEIVYATPVDSMGFLGALSARLPQPDMVVTHTRWDVFLPAGPRYRAPDSTMDVVVRGVRVNPQRLGGPAMAGRVAANDAALGQPLRVTVPTQGVHFAFEKLYANQSPEDARFSIKYASVQGNQVGLLLSVLGTLSLWFCIFATRSSRMTVPRGTIVGGLILGVALVLVSLGYLGSSPVLAATMSIAIAVAFVLWLVIQQVRTWRLRRAMAPEPT